ncbi:hypothetical protein ABPG74_021552 [Tetrahymena malaccensis]
MEDNFNDQPFKKENNFFNDGTQSVGDADVAAGNNVNISSQQLEIQQNQNVLQQFEDFNENQNEATNSYQNLEQRGLNNGLLNVEDENDETNIKSSFKSDNEMLNQKSGNNNMSLSNKEDYGIEQLESKVSSDKENSKKSNNHANHNAQNILKEESRNISPLRYDQDEEKIPINQSSHSKVVEQKQMKSQSDVQSQNKINSVQQDSHVNQYYHETSKEDDDNSGSYKKQKSNNPLANQIGGHPLKFQEVQQIQSPNYEQKKLNQEHVNEDSHHKLKQKLEPLPIQPKQIGQKVSANNHFDDSPQNKNQNNLKQNKINDNQQSHINSKNNEGTFKTSGINQFDDSYQQQILSHQITEQKSLQNLQNIHKLEHQVIDIPPNQTQNNHQTRAEDKTDKDNEDHPKEELDPKFDEPMHPFKLSRNQLIRIASAAQQRHFAEEVDILESLGGIERFQHDLKTDFKKGISATEADMNDRDQAFSNNKQEVSPPKGFFELFFDALQDFTLKILLVAAVFSIAIEVGTASDSHRSTAWVEGVAIFVAVFVCATVTSVNDYQKERQFLVLNSEADKRKIITIIRNGQKENLHQSLVMVGDLVELTEGMEIPADGIVLEASELTTDESAMTGETDPLKKSTLSDCIKKRDFIINQGAKNVSSSHDVPSPVLLSGTRILTGQGKMLIIVVGDFSCVGKISKLLKSKETEATPLQEKLEAIAMDIGNLGLKSAIAIVAALFIRFAIEKIVNNSWDNSQDWGEMLNFIIIGITVVVVAIPEGLPLSVTLSLAYSVKKMLKDNNLVRKLQACETMGGADCICSDKTGTLTQNVMTLTSWWNEELQEFDKYNEKDELANYIAPERKFFSKLFLQSCAINCSADLRPAEKGSKTEVAVLKLLEKFDQNYETWREKYIPELTFPFSSARKRMSTVINSDGKRILLVKGASELVLAACNKFISKKNEEIRKIDEEQLQTMKNAIKSMADNALRTIVLAYKELKDNDDLETKDHLGVFDIETKDLTCLAIFGIKDILRQEVPGAVKQCQDAGIKVRMVTGDNSDTARAIARDCNILTKGKKGSPYQVIEGVEFIKLTGGIVCKKCQTFECGCERDSEKAKETGKPLRIDTIKNGEVFDRIYNDIDVMARSRPEDKYALVVGLIERKHVVAVTGDGTNDAPALKKADVGFAMGIAGTEVARSAAAIILLDDNFKSIVSAVLWGRNIYDSIKKFLQFQLTVNIVAVFITLIGAAVIKQEVLQPIQMLWINLIMDTFASLALATEPPHEELLLRKPHNRDEYIVSKKMFKHVIGQAIYQLVIMIVLVFNGETFLPEVSDSFDNQIRNNTLYNNDPTQWWKAKYSNEKMTLVCSGRLRTYSGTEKDYQTAWDEYQQPSRHFSTIFNVFVWMQIFNFLNARKLQDELNVFEGIFKNYLFFVILLLIIGFQILIMQVGGLPFYIYKNGLNGGNWGISIAFGFGSLVWGFCLKFVSEEKCAQFGKKKVNPLHNFSRVLSLKGNRDEASMSRRYSALINHPNALRH